MFVTRRGTLYLVFFIENVATDARKHHSIGPGTPPETILIAQITYTIVMGTG